MADILGDFHHTDVDSLLGSRGTIIIAEPPSTHNMEWVESYSDTSSMEGTANMVNEADNEGVLLDSHLLVHCGHFPRPRASGQGPRHDCY